MLYYIYGFIYKQKNKLYIIYFYFYFQEKGLCHDALVTGVRETKPFTCSPKTSDTDKSYFPVSKYKS